MIKRLLIPLTLSALVGACSSSDERGALNTQTSSANQAKNAASSHASEAQLQTLVEQLSLIHI